MRIERLDLVAFGNFTDVSLNLSAPGLQIIYGPNEAGKTTARAAISNLLYDFDVRTAYAFVHPMAKLQLGALLRAEDAKTLDVIRYKRNKEPLLEAGSNRPVNSSEWARLLQGVSRSDFESMFTLGWDELVRGTAELLTRGGVLGETLFAAGLGVRELGAVLTQLDAEAAALFSLRPSAKTVNAALKAHAEALKRATELSVRPTHYGDVLKKHEKAVTRRDELATKRRDLEREQERLVTLRGVLPTLRDRTKKLEERSELLNAGHVAPASWAERVEQALESRSELTRRRSEAAGQVAVAEEKLGAITVDDALLAVSERVDALAEGIAGYVEGRSDRGGLDEGRRDAERDALSILQTLTGEAPGISELEDARLVLTGKEAFSPARDEWTEKEAALRRAREAVRSFEDEISEIKDALALLAEVPETSALRDTVDATLRQGDLDGTFASTRTAFAAAQSERVGMAGRLGLLEDYIAAAVVSPSPSTEQVEEILGQLDEAATNSRAAEERAKTGVQREGVLTGELQMLALEGELPGEADLADHRNVRNETWALVKASWLEGQAVTGQATAYSDERALATSYEQASQDADSTVDRLWQEADRTARRNALMAERERVRDECAMALEESQREREGAAAAYAEWRSVWTGQRLPESSGALRQWTGNLERLRLLQADWTTRRLAHREAFRSLRMHRGRLVELLAIFDVEAVGGNDLAPVLAQATEFLSGIEKNRDERVERESRLRTLERGLPKKQDGVDKALAAEQTAAAGLVGILGPYGSGVTSPQSAGELLARIDRLARLLESRDSRLQRVAGIDRRSAGFEGDLRDVLTGAPDISPEPTVDAARTLVRRVQTARDADAARQAILANQEHAQSDLDIADAKLTGLQDELALLVSEGGIEDIDLLGSEADRAQRVATLGDEISGYDTLLADQGGGRSIIELEADGLGRDLADVNATIEECKDSRDAHSEEERIVSDEESDLKRDLMAMDGSDDAAAEATRSQLELSRAVEAAERYSRVVLARFLANEAIRRYSEAHQDPLLQQASRYLALLTEGRCREVGVDDDPKKGPRLSAIYSSGEERLVAELSDGTRDQLYFALRLAAIEESFARTGPMPVVLDDVLVNFDDDRARSALRCLAALATTSQVLLFTHHRHVLALAEETLTADEFVAQELPDLTLVSTD
jgi:uncharacterized protein YhaN